MSPVIELKRITKQFGSVLAVNAVDLTVEDGEFLTLLGPSGCGKSTLLRMIGGFETPSNGSICLMGQDVTDVPPQKRDVNMMFQDYALFPHMTVGQNIAYGLKMKGFTKSNATEKAREALDLVSLSDKFNAMPHELSGGQKQRVALARAIVRQPKVLLLDEPLSALDAKLRDQMQVELKHLHEKIGITFIMVTHDQTEALVMSDRVVVMNAGQIAQDGTPKELYENPISSYVANFIGTTNIINAKVKKTTLGQTAYTISQNKDILGKPTSAASGASVKIGIRPEKFNFSSGKKSSTRNILEGTVSELIYHGNSLRILVDINDQITVMVDTMLSSQDSDKDIPSHGQKVHVEVAPEHVLSFDK